MKPSAKATWKYALPVLVSAGAALFSALLLGEVSPVLGVVLAFGALAGLCLSTRLAHQQSEEERLQNHLLRLQGRLSLIEAGDNIHLDYPWEDEGKPLVDALNYLSGEMAQMGRKLSNEKKKADYILDNMDSGLLLVDRELQIRQCNTSAYKYLAQNGGDLLGLPLGQAHGSEDFLQAVQDALDKEIATVLDLDLTQESGVVVSARINPISGGWMGAEGGVWAVIILQNVTQTRHLERMRSEFVANVSHELKTPITSIKGFAELLGAGMVTDREKVEGYIGRIHEESVRMTYLIEDILRLSSLEGQNTQQRHEPVDLAVLAEDVFYSLTPQMNGKSIVGEVGGRAVYYAYPDDMRQLLKNLIENAVKYNVEGGRVAVRLGQNAYSCTITVSDTGIGIPLEHQPRIFERFYRVDKGRSKREGGTGLGLSIVKHVAAKYRGQLTLTSKMDAGTTIKVILPFQKEE